MQFIISRNHYQVGLYDETLLEPKVDVFQSPMTDFDFTSDSSYHFQFQN